MLLSSQKQIYNKTTILHVISQLMVLGDGWGTGEARRGARERSRVGLGWVRARELGRGRAGRALEHTGGKGQGVRRTTQTRLDGAGRAGRSTWAGRGKGHARGNTQVGRGRRARENIPTLPYCGRFATINRPRPPTTTPTPHAYAHVRHIVLPPCLAHAD